MRYIFLMISALSFLAGSVEAFDRAACKADVEKFCKDVQKGGGRIVRCLKEHEKDASPDCQKAIAARKVKWHLCEADSEKFCKDVQKGGGRKIRCLKEHEAQLSPECKGALTK